MPPLDDQVITRLATLSERGLSANRRNGLIIGIVGAVLLAIMICYAKKWVFLRGLEVDVFLLGISRAIMVREVQRNRMNYTIIQIDEILNQPNFTAPRILNFIFLLPETIMNYVPPGEKTSGDHKNFVGRADTEGQGGLVALGQFPSQRIGEPEIVTGNQMQ
ncbi:hypothetical protein NA56DRAFT_709506 [Hyaloscypha hepaticicola]|uniref:Uncharacterized protein n=1 Tax=Hyaloscypha hepaticicola TaxID=2082293 RepID=A0A2J6PPA8_9HELO|nr:hypothetical protein NA56DRAFT_709506 [Hyaloscypha hepaticicola]